jgi:hypothetical protein
MKLTFPSKTAMVAQTFLSASVYAEFTDNNTEFTDKNVCATEACCRTLAEIFLRTKRENSFVCAAIAPILVYLSFFSTPVFAQSSDTTAIRFGVGGAYLLNRHDVNFSKLEGIPSCCDELYGNANSQGWGASVSAEFPLLRLGEIGTVGIAGRVQFLSGLGAVLTANSRPIIRLGTNIEQANIEHRFNPNFSLLAIEPLATVRVLKWLSLYGGVQVGTWLQRSYLYEERLISPANFVFENDRTVRNEQIGQVPNINALQVAFVGGISYELPVSRTGTILPTLEAFYTYNFTSPVSATNWRISSVRVGASLRYSPYRTTELTVQEIEQRYQDSICIARELAEKALAEAKDARKKQLDAKINDVRPIFFDDEETPTNDTTARNLGGAIAAKLSLDNFELTVQKFTAIHKIELLPMVFFNENSSVLPVRYKTMVTTSDATKFTMEAASTVADVQKNPINAYYRILNILGKRLQDNPSATIVLTGVATEKEQDGSFLADMLAVRRAQAVSNYLQDIWRIPVSRISTKSRIVPSAATKQENEELRRVEIESSEAGTLSAVRLEGEKRLVTPQGLQIGLQIAAGQGLKQWDVDISQSTGLEVVSLLSQSGGANYPERIICDFRTNPPVSEQDLAIRLTIDDASNNKFESPIVAVKVKENPQKGTIQTFTLLQANTPLLSNIQEAQKSSSNTSIRSQDSGFLRGVAALGEKNIRVQKKPLFDANVPEGRLYNRGGTVEVRK